MTAPFGPLPLGFDITDRLRAAALGPDDMPTEDVAALFREAATVIEELRKEVLVAELAAASIKGSA